MQLDGSRVTRLPSLIRSAPDPLGLYIHAGRNDHGELLSLLAQGDARCFGFIIEATALKRHRELRERALAAKVDAILDPRTQPAATLGGHSSEIAALPWGRERPHVSGDFQGAAGRRIIASIGDCVLEHGFTEVIAPTHVLSSSADEWFAIDVESTRLLRAHLNAHGGEHVQILYSLAVPYAVFRDPLERRALVRELRNAHADALWLRIDGLGAAATPNGIRSYIEGAREFAALSIPIVADGMGGIAGLSVLAFGAAGGLAHGVTFGERVSNASWRRVRSGKGFGPVRRVYLPELDLMLDPDDAETFLRSSSRAQALFACRDTACCRRGLRDMLEDPARHFLIQRMKQVGSLGRVPTSLRAEQFLETHVRPATDLVLQATNLKIKDEAMAAKLRKHRKHMDAIRVALAAMPREAMAAERAILPKTRMAREPRVGL
jgi:hypothetical protein